MSTDIDWYYVDVSGAQIGPVTLPQVQAAFQEKKADANSLVWNENMTDWIKFSTVPELQHLCKPKIPPKAVPAIPKKPSPSTSVTPADRPQSQSIAQPQSPTNPAPAAKGIQPTLPPKKTSMMSVPAAPEKKGASTTATATATTTAGSNGGKIAAQAASAVKQLKPTNTSPVPSPTASASAPAPAPPPASASATVPAPPTAKKDEKKKDEKSIKKRAESEEEPPVDWVELVTPEGYPYYYNKKTGQTSWDKPDCLKTGDELDKSGDWVWMPHDEEAFVPARKIEVLYDGKTALETEDGRTHTLAKGVVLEPLLWSQLRRLQRDLVMLDIMNQPLILYNLKQRFVKNEIYTNVGTILISVNPYKRLPLYTPTIIDEYRHRGNKELPPHVFTIADDAYVDLVENNRSQSIVISGESGSGKTECTKQCLQYLAEVAGSSTNVEQKILLANPILEAFGNAKTVRNNNSSRFGKYVEIFFDERFAICGARNTNYLLEKSRVVQTTGDERNYHIFYQLCAGFAADQRTKYNIQEAKTYRYLNQSGNVTIDGVDDAQEFSEMESALKLLNFTDDERHSMYRIVCGVLHLGNVEIKATGERKSEAETKGALERSAQLFEFTTEQLCKAITERTMRIKDKNAILIPHSLDEAVATRNALAKFIYAKLFDWLVWRVNESIGLGPTKKKKSTIGILDIFGFEIFETNYFEQLCINFANEKLQQYFNAHTFKKEETVYRQEKIEFEHVAYIDNQPVLDLIEKKPDGLLPLIDEELKMPKGSDQSFVDKLVTRCKGKKEFETILKSPEKFVVVHYAGRVIYESEGFLVKNLDRMSEDILDLMELSKFAFLKELLKDEKEEIRSQRKETLGAKFQRQLNDLMTTLNNTEPHYIRCIKPNKEKAPLEFMGVLVLQQLQYSGVFEAVQIRKSGYPFRLTHTEFRKRFKCIMPKTKWPNDKKACEDLIKEMKQDLKQVQVGVSKVLYRAEQHRAMELARNLAVEKTVTFLQRVTRGWLSRKLYKRMKKLKPILENAMKTRTVEALDQALSQADGLNFPMFLLEKAKRLKFIILEEKRINNLLEGLLAKDPETVFEELSKAVASADEIELKSPAAEKARKQVKQVIDLKKCRKWLQEGVDEADLEKLTWALDKAKELSLNAPGLIKAAADMVERIKKEKQLTEKVQKSSMTGGYLKEGDAISWNDLQASLAECKKFGIKTTEGLKIEKMGNILLDLRQKLKAALGTKDKEKWKAVEKVVISASEYQDHPEIKMALEEVSHQAAVEEVCEQLEQAVTELNQEQLEYCLQQAQKLQIDEQKYPVVDVARQYLDRIVSCRDIMKKAVELVDQTQLEYAIEYAESFKYETEEVKQCRELRDKVAQINVEAEYANKMLEEEPMKDILARADAINLKTDDIERIRTLLYNTPEEKFVQLQLKAAVAMNDAARATRVTIKLKDLFFKKSGQMFVFDNYPKLRSPNGWADLKFLSLKRDALAASMKLHTKTPIHAPLTEMDKKKSKVACNMFKNIMGFMGDRAYPSPIILASEVLSTGLDNPWIRDEIYCQIIKQVTKNPSPESTSKGWQLMALALETFPPNSEFENYLEMYLRNNANPPERYIRTLHAIVYGGARKTAPTESEIQTILAGGTLQNITFEEKKDYIVPKAVIKSKYAGGGASQTTSETGGEGDGANSLSPPPKKKGNSPWNIANHPETGQEYYYNTETGDVTWDKPPELA